MQFNLPVLVCSLLITASLSCKKEEKKGDCFPGALTVRRLTDRPAVVKVTGTVYFAYLVEQGTIDTKLIPCNLPKEFLQDGLQVTVSGEVKASPQTSGPCCAENFVITKISK